MALPAPGVQAQFAPSAGRLAFDDFDAQREVSSAWDERYTQIGRGRAHVSAAVATTKRMQLAYISRSPGCRVEGAPVEGTSILAIAVAGPFLHLQGQAWKPDHFAYVPSGAHYEIMSSAPHRALAVSVRSDLLDRVARACWGHSLPLDRSGPILRARLPGDSQDVARSWFRWVTLAVRHPDILRDPHVATQMEEEVLGALLNASELVGGPVTERPWRELALRADAYIRQTLAEAPHLEQLCDAVQASPRSLHASFKTIFNATPRAYQTALRLDAARRDLLRGPPGTTVSSVAVRWGFFQFGRFAGAYRQMFGEEPRQTLRRTRAPRVHAFAATPPGLHGQ
jgi:AraC-like DNA-binding protein